MLLRLEVKKILVKFQLLVLFVKKKLKGEIKETAACRGQVDVYE